MEILEFISKEAAAPLMSVAAPLWFWKFREKIQILDFFLEILKILENLKNDSIKHDLARSCFNYGPKSATRVTKFREGGDPFDVSGGPSVVLEISRKNSKFWIFLRILKIMENFEQLRLIISKEGGKF